MVLELIFFVGLFSTVVNARSTTEEVKMHILPRGYVLDDPDNDLYQIMLW